MRDMRKWSDAKLQARQEALRVLLAATAPKDGVAPNKEMEGFRKYWRRDLYQVQTEMSVRGIQ